MVEIRRPTNEGQDREKILTFKGDGVYEADIVLPLQGQWDLRMQARNNRNQIYQLERRLWVK